MPELEERKGSYEKINYSLRVSKAIERKMISETLQRLHVFGSLDTYRYIGFGSTFFSDFSLFHKNLGINNMISIEKDEPKKPRFDFNRPYDCIQMEYEESTVFLASTNWDYKTILWLDYDGKLEDYMLTDIKYAVMSAISGSVILMSVNAHPDEFDSQDRDIRLRKLRERVSEENIPINVTSRDLRGWGLASVYRRIINNVIIENINVRNGILRDGNKFKYKQLFNMLYADGAKMLTVGGILYEEKFEELFQMCAFNNLEFLSENENAHLIEVPSLTLKEMRHLDKQLPLYGDRQLNDDGLMISEEDLRKYASIYRYFPTFAETNL